MTKLKFCGMMRVEDIDFVNALKPDFVGFIFAKNRRRTITMEQAEIFRKKLDAQISAVGVFVNNPLEEVLSLVKRDVIQVIQLHGGEDASYIAELRKQCNTPIIQAFRIDSTADFLKAEQSSADYILLDHGAGGTGTTFDWNLLNQISRPFFMAGGLNPENIAEAIQRFSPYGVDLSSGIESDGIKDFEKMQKVKKILDDINTVR